ncbi:MAG: hypothetical protein KME20_14910 [Kaiparowitsia implicata GSE-PSE-MK54-09C]|jgi:DNA-binding beta-propeller fold protein YncE|nr:hypothetical protein [Kaiparowitsia implicata GSE-PSE-MK54-09C]
MRPLSVFFARLNQYFGKFWRSPNPNPQRISRYGLVAIALASLIVLSQGWPAPAQQPIRIQGEVVDTLTDLGGAEMLTVSRDGQFTVVAGADVVTVVQIGDRTLDLINSFELTPDLLPEGSTSAEFTGLAISPDGSYVLVAVRDNDEANSATFDEVPGKVIAFSVPDLEVLGQTAVGRGPDSVAIAPNGLFAAVANEDEENEEDLTNLENRPGTVSIIDLRRGPSRLSQFELPLPQENIPFFPHDPQPETVRIAADSSFILVTLQENNAVARIDVPRRLPFRMRARNFQVQNFDMGIRTGFGLTRDRVGEGLCRSSSYDLSQRQSYTSAREPDGLAISPDLSFFVTADEDNLTAVNEQSYNSVLLSPHGTRSISAYDATTGALLSDSGDTIEDSILALGLPQRCNSKGPEPEVVSIAEIEGRTLAAVAIERSDAITIHDVTDPSNITLLDTVILDDTVVRADIAAELEPEGIEFVPGGNKIVVSNPENSTITLVNLVRLDR